MVWGAFERFGLQGTVFVVQVVLVCFYFLGIVSTGLPSEKLIVFVRQVTF